MSDNGQGGGERSWWAPDQEPAAQDPYRATSGDSPGGDAHDPYRVEPGPAAPTQSIPQPGSPPYAPPQPSWQDQQQHQQHPGQQYGNPPAGQYGTPQHPGQQYGNPPAGQYGTPQHPNQQYPNQQYPDAQGGYGYPAVPVAGSAHAVLWTAVGGLVLLFSGLGWIAAIVALALTPGARREILEAQGAKRGLGFLLAGKICAWVTIGLSALALLGLAIVVGLGANGAFDGTSSYDSSGLDTVFVP